MGQGPTAVTRKAGQPGKKRSLKTRLSKQRGRPDCRPLCEYRGPEALDRDVICWTLRTTDTSP